MPKFPARMTCLDQIIAYENGDLDNDAVGTLFRYLVKTGMIYSLQGSYGRAAHAMGLI